MQNTGGARVVGRANGAVVRGVVVASESRIAEDTVAIVRHRPRHRSLVRCWPLCLLLASLSLSLGACAFGGGIVSIRRGGADGLITVEDMQTNVDTLVRSACQRMVGDSARAKGSAALRIDQDPHELETRASVTRSSGDLYMDQVLADLASQLAPRYRENEMRVYNPRYEVAVHYSCARDAYGVTGVAAIEL